MVRLCRESLSSHHTAFPAAVSYAFRGPSVDRQPSFALTIERNDQRNSCPGQARRPSPRTTSSIASAASPASAASVTSAPSTPWRPAFSHSCSAATHGSPSSLMNHAKSMKEKYVSDSQPIPMTPREHPSGRSPASNPPWTKFTAICPPSPDASSNCRPSIPPRRSMASPPTNSRAKTKLSR